jgi:hypothetical protein
MLKKFNLENNNSFNHPHIDVGYCWEKLKKVGMGKKASKSFEGWSRQH